MATTCDILIVGGGVMGTSIAFHLAKAKAGSVILLEKSFLGAGSSGKSGAIIRQYYSNCLTVEMARKGLEAFQHFPDVVCGPEVFSHTGIVLIAPASERDNLEVTLKMQQEIGVNVRFIDAQELAEIDANAHLAEDELAIFESEAGYVEAVQVVDSFAAEAQRRRADIRLGVEVQSIKTNKGRVTRVETNEGIYECGKLILTTGPWAARLADSFNIALPVQPCRTQVGLYRTPASSRRGTIYGDFVHGVYFKPTHGQMIHAGSLAGEEVHNVVDPDNYPEAADSSWLPGIRQSLNRRYPLMNQSYGRGGFGALYGITPDWHPILDRVPGFEDVYLAVGFSGHGFKMSPIVGQLMTEMVLEGQTKTLDISAFRLSRFEENALVGAEKSHSVMG